MTSSALAGLALLAVLVTAWYTRRRLQEIHVLVNRRLEVALQEIRQLKQAAKEQTAETVVKDKAQAVKDQGSAPVVPSDAGRIDDG